MSRNPYQNEGKSPQIRPSVVAFIDILGYMDLISSAEKSDTQNEVLKRLHESLSAGRTWLEEAYAGSSELKKLTKVDRYVLKAFTDNIVIAWPIRQDGEVEIGNAYSKLSDFQFTMSLEGFFVRGGIAVGNAYVDDITVFGDGVTQAYIGESKIARDPRIVLTESAVAAVKEHLEYYGNPRHAPQTSEFLIDSDGQWFVNYLECVLIAADERGPFYDEFLRHKSAVERKLLEYKNDPPIFSKYAWVANYHNYFCDLYPAYFSTEHKIETEVFRAVPRRIVD